MTIYGKGCISNYRNRSLYYVCYSVLYRMLTFLIAFLRILWLERGGKKRVYLPIHPHLFKYFYRILNFLRISRLLCNTINSNSIINNAIYCGIIFTRFLDSPFTREIRIYGVVFCNQSIVTIF